MPSVDMLSVDTEAKELPAVDFGVLGIALVFLALGSGLAVARESAPETHVLLDERVRVTVPGGWAIDEDGDAVLISGGTLMERGMSVRIEKVSSGEEPGALDVAGVRVLEERRQHEAFRVLHAEDISGDFGGHEVAYTHFAYASDPDGVHRGAAVLPEVVRGFDALLRTSGGVWHVGVTGPPEPDEDVHAELDALLGSLMLLEEPYVAPEIVPAPAETPAPDDFERLHGGS